MQTTWAQPSFVRAMDRACWSLDGRAVRIIRPASEIPCDTEIRNGGKRSLPAQRQLGGVWRARREGCEFGTAGCVVEEVADLGDDGERAIPQRDTVLGAKVHGHAVRQPAGAPLVEHQPAVF